MDRNTEHNICWNQAADRLEEVMFQTMEHSDFAHRLVTEVLKGLIIEFKEIAGKQAGSGFTTYNDPHACPLCGKMECRGTCFK